MEHVDYSGEECLIWPFATAAGYGKIYLEGKLHGVHRVMCKRAHGPAPSPEHVVAHSCGKGGLACVNPNHIRWATTKENIDDAANHGTGWVGEGIKHKNARLTEAQVWSIRYLHNTGMGYKRLAKRFGVGPTTIANIIKKNTWRHLV